MFKYSKLHNLIKIRKLFVVTFHIFAFYYVTTAITYSSKLHEDVNVLLFTVDSLRPDHLGCYGYKRNTTPKLDALASTGVVFDQAIAQSAWTSPGLISILTSLYPHSHKVEAQGQSIDKGTITLPKILKKNGYVCPAFSYLIGYPNNYHLGFEAAPEHIYKGRSLDDLFKLLEIYKDDKFFIWYHDKSIHLPYRPTYPYNKFLSQDLEEKNSNMSSGLLAVMNKGVVKKGTVKFEKDDKQKVLELYDAIVRRLDDRISSLITKLEELKLLNNTLVIITADHGEELLDHGFVGHASTSLSAKLYDEVIRIPLIFLLPGHLSPQTINNQVQQIDIFPTILDILNITIPSSLQGRSLMPLMRKQKQDWPEYALSRSISGGYQTPEEMKDIFLISLRTSEWKLICKKNKEDREYELYNLKDDPKEIKDIIGDYPNIFSNLKSVMERLEN